MSNCELCNRKLSLTFHHLIPKKVHDKTYIIKQIDDSIEDLDTYGINLCSDCHSFIHRKLSHKELALSYNTANKLLLHPDVQKFVAWVSKQRKKVKRN